MENIRKEGKSFTRKAGYMLIGLLISLNVVAQVYHEQDYLKEIKAELIKKWPDNRTINLVFHGHSVPAGYFKTPVVNTMDSYPYQLLRELKKKYPYAVINIINTAIGGENSKSGSSRFKSDVFPHKPDVLFIDYALNDLGIGLEEAKRNWTKMINAALERGLKVILLTPSPDQRVDLHEEGTDLEKHAIQIKVLSEEKGVGCVDSYSLFRKQVTNANKIKKYMSQVNHPNKEGHEIIVREIMKYFK
jgi:lysophospholipase L1-like esterase